MKKVFLAYFLTFVLACYGQDSNLFLVIGPEALADKIHETALQVSEDYRDKDLSIVMVMKGAICVTADLIRHMDIPFKLEYLKASSYGYRGMKGGELSIEGLDCLDIEGRDVLLVDDIFETGNTILGIIQQLEQKNPKSIKSLIAPRQRCP